MKFISFYYFTITNLSETGIIYIKLDKFSNAENVYVKLEIDKGEINDYINVKFSNTPTIGINNFTKYNYDFEILFKFLLDYS